MQHCLSNINGNHSYQPEEEEEVKSKPSPAKKVKIESPPASGPAVAAVTGGSGGPVEIVFSFDTTGSMYPCLTQVESDVQCIHVCIS